MNKFWETIPLHKMNKTQWESLCDRCGKCCVHKFIDEDTEEIIYTKVACKLLDLNTCQCKNYKKRTADCITLTVDDIDEFKWLPKTCAYRLLSEKKPLPTWHPLLTGSPKTVHLSGNSAHGKLIPEEMAKNDFLAFEVENP
jgi:uncharacterized cysteine cluster protein YcgN (CxxCxxCC family)